MNKLRVYLAGPMRGRPLFNFPAFFKAAIVLRAQGYDVVNPAEGDMAAGLNPAIPVDHIDQIPFDIEKILRNDFIEVLEADIICLLPGWEDSSGAKDEHHIALRTGRKIRFWDPDDEVMKYIGGAPTSEIVLKTDLDYEDPDLSNDRLWASLPGIKSLRLSLVGSNNEEATVRVDVVDSVTGEAIYDFGNIALENSNHQVLLKLDAEVELEEEVSS